MTGEMKDALEAARRIERERYIGSQFVADARKVAKALLSTDKAAGELFGGLSSLAPVRVEGTTVVLCCAGRAQAEDMAGKIKAALTASGASEEGK